MNVHGDEKYMIKMFHPVSGEPVTCFTDKEMVFITLALQELDNKTSSHALSVGGVTGE